MTRVRTVPEDWLNRSYSQEEARGSIVKGVESEAEKIARLTGQERVIILLVAKGLSDQKIAQRLCITDADVHGHFCSIYGKLEVKDRLDLLIYGFLHGLVKAASVP
jgi:DNA-binding NarL/FixJ family response regulator